MRRGWSRVPFRAAPNGDCTSRQMKNIATAKTIRVNQ